MSVLPNPVVTLTTDYGTSDHFVGVMKGIILGILPNAIIVDINHHVAPFDILDGALAIGSSYSYFSSRTVHVVVVDPGVGTERRPILVRCENGYFVAPDNGVLSLIYEREKYLQVRHITATHYFMNSIGNTFHGRDIFAPAAAWLARNLQPEAFGDEIADYVRFSLPRPTLDGAALKGVVLRADAFGNLLTNFTAEDLPPAMVAEGKMALEIAGKRVEQLAQNFAQGAAGQPFAIFGSTGFLEIAVNQGSAVKLLAAGRGAEVILRLS